LWISLDGRSYAQARVVTRTAFDAQNGCSGAASGPHAGMATGPAGAFGSTSNARSSRSAPVRSPLYGEPDDNFGPLQKSVAFATECPSASGGVTATVSVCEPPDVSDGEPRSPQGNAYCV
jgi:hypothetical protein